MAELTTGQSRLLRFWGANMTFAFATSDWWPGFSYSAAEKERLATLGRTIPPGAIALWMFLLVPVIFIAIAAVAVVVLMLPTLTLLYPNPADLQPLPFALIMASVVVVSLGIGLPVAMALGGRLALRMTGDTGTFEPQPGDADLYGKFRRQLWRVAIVACGVFVPGCWLWIAYDIHAGPVVTILKWASVAAMLASGVSLWRSRGA